jgi:hypothetical protein
MIQKFYIGEMRNQQKKHQGRLSKQVDTIALFLTFVFSLFQISINI